MKCIECGASQLRLTTGAEIYPHRHDLHGLSFYKCDCCDDAYVGCHRGTTNPLGHAAGRETRSLRQQCHAMFDPMWRNKKPFRSRTKAYNWLANRMGRQQVHFSQLTADECREAVKIINTMAQRYASLT